MNLSSVHSADGPGRSAVAPRRIVAIATFFLLWALATVAAPSPRDSMVVSASWLAQHLKDPDLILLQVGDKGDYPAGHIPGARMVSQSDVSISDHSGKGLMLEMPPAEDLRARLASLGISDKSRIVVYYSKDWISPATRIVFTLDYAGLGDRTSLLDGGQAAWVRSGGAVTKDVPAPKTGQLSPLRIHPIVVDGAWVREHLNKPGTAVIDGRDAMFYDGVERGGDDSHPDRAGHIPGAHSVPYSSITDDQNMLRSPEELETLFRAAGVKPGDTVVGYCHIGQQATAMLFAARSLGHPVMLYDGSFQDWSKHADYPVENPSAKAGK